MTFFLSHGMILLLTPQVLKLRRFLLLQDVIH
jgi:hypothetical protein